MNTVSTPRRRAISIFFLAALSFVYFIGATLSFLNTKATETLNPKTISNARADASLKKTFLHDGTYFRELAEKLQFVPHDSKVIDRCYEIALQKSPADYKNFSSYASYMEGRACCAETVAWLVEGMVLRSPQNPASNLMAGRILLESGKRDAALRYFKRTLESGGSLSDDFYGRIESGGNGTADLILITPKQATPLLNLARYLSRKGFSGERDLHLVMTDLASVPMETEQRIAFAKLAVQTGDIEMARKQALIARQSGTNIISALQLLADIAAQRQDWTEYKKISAEIRSLYRKEGREEASCQLALKSIERVKKPGKDVVVRLTQILEAHPDCVMAYWRLAEALSAESPDSAAVYLQKASALAPEDFKVAGRLAELYIKQSKFVEAEAIYLSFTDSPNDSQSAYLGLSRCKVVQGDFPSAELVLKQGIERSENIGQLWRELGKVYVKEGNLLDAAEAFSHFASLTSDKPEGFLLAGDVYRSMGRTEAARRQYERALAADAQNRRALESLKSLNSFR